MFALDPVRSFPLSRQCVARLGIAGLFLLVASAVSGAGAVDRKFPSYQPEAQPALTTPHAPAEWLIFGYNDMRELLEPLVERFALTHGGQRPGLELPGTRFAPAALSSGKAAIAPMGAELTPTQRQAYRKEVGDDPIEVKVAHASLDPRALSGPLGVFVHAGNPITFLTLDQLAQIFSGTVTRWRDLGAIGPWADLPVHAYGVQRGSPLAYSMLNATHADAVLFGTSVTGLPQSAEVVSTVANDPMGIGYAAAMRSTPQVRMVPVAPHSGETALLPGGQSDTAGQYPLDRFLYIYARRPLTAFARDFLTLMLSREGQEAVIATPQHYIALSAGEATVERAKLAP